MNISRFFILQIFIALFCLKTVVQANSFSLNHSPKTFCIDLHDIRAMTIDKGDDTASASDDKLVIQSNNGRYEINFLDHAVTVEGRTYYIEVNDRYAYFPIYANKLNDDSSSIQAAIDLIVNAGGGTLLLPEGDLLMKQPIRIPPDVHSQLRIVGMGRPNNAEDKVLQSPGEKYAKGGTRLRFSIDEQSYASNYPAFYFSTDGQLPLLINNRPSIKLPGDAGVLDNHLGTGKLDPWNYSSSSFVGNAGTRGVHLVIEHLAILSDIDSRGIRLIENRDGLLIRGAHKPLIHNITISGFAGCGLIISGSYGGTISNSDFNYNGVGIRGYIANGVKVNHCSIRENTIGLQNIEANHSIIEANHLFGFLADSGTVGWLSSFDGCFFEANNYEGGGIGADICVLSDSYRSLKISSCHFSSLRADTHNIYGRFREIFLFNTLSNINSSEDFLAQIYLTDSRATIHDYYGIIDGKNIQVKHENPYTNVNINSPHIRFHGSNHYNEPLTATAIDNHILTFNQLSGLQTLKLDNPSSPVEIHHFNFPVALHGGHEFKLHVYNSSTTAGVRFVNNGNLRWGKNQPDSFEVFGDEVLTWISITDPVLFQTKWYLVSRAQVLNPPSTPSNLRIK